MALRDLSHFPNQTKKVPFFLPLLSLLCFISIFAVLSYIRNTSSAPSQPHSSLEFRKPPGSCDDYGGTWIYDPNASPKYDNTCKEIFKGWNCISRNKSNGRELVKWRWKPKHCDLPPFDPAKFLEMYRNTSILCRVYW